MQNCGTSSNAPVNVPATGGKRAQSILPCNVKCSYQRGYYTSSCTATNQGYYLSLTYDAPSSSLQNPVVYNGMAYAVSEVRIYAPSIHSYGDGALAKKTDAEMIIIHNTNSGGGNTLLVCIPMKLNNVSSYSANWMSALMSTVVNVCPSAGDTASNVIFPAQAPYQLDNLVPLKPFYSYTGNQPFQPCGGTYDYIVFSADVVTLDITTNALNQLTQVIQPHAYTVASQQNAATLFYNSTGPVPLSSSGDGQMYMDCESMNEQQEHDSKIPAQLPATTTTSKSSSSYALQQQRKQTIQSIIIGIIVAIVLLLLIYVLIFIIQQLRRQAK